ncbi:hypothetical protein RJT34_31736 [Clitoria ternatea]|uniref:Uncharacterized protein n=1 Tax=Clitoria ternatea TaxID=43366 RepID=A0AAN9EV65_CLITE
MPCMSYVSATYLLNWMQVMATVELHDVLAPSRVIWDLIHTISSSHRKSGKVKKSHLALEETNAGIDQIGFVGNVLCLRGHWIGNKPGRSKFLMDEVLASVSEMIKKFAVIYLVDITEVSTPCPVMFFLRNKHIMIDLGTGINNNKQKFIVIVETVYCGACKERGLVISPRDYSIKYRFLIH